MRVFQSGNRARFFATGRKTRRGRGINAKMRERSLMRARCAYDGRYNPDIARTWRDAVRGDSTNKDQMRLRPPAQVTRAPGSILRSVIAVRSAGTDMRRRSDHRLASGMRPVSVAENTADTSRAQPGSQKIAKKPGSSTRASTYSSLLHREGTRVDCCRMARGRTCFGLMRLCSTVWARTTLRLARPKCSSCAPPEPGFARSDDA